MESVLSLFRSLNENRCYFINKIDFGNKHSGDKRPNDSKVFEVHVELDSFHTESTA